MPCYPVRRESPLPRIAGYEAVRSNSGEISVVVGLNPVTGYFDFFFLLIVQPNFLAHARTKAFWLLSAALGSARYRLFGLSTESVSITLSTTRSPTFRSRSAHVTCSRVSVNSPA